MDKRVDRQKVFKIYSCLAEGQAGIMSEIEVSILPGIPTFDVIGLCDSSIRESRGRIQAALISAGFMVPRGHITVSISPAYMHKSGSSFDLPIALGMLFASKQLTVPSGYRIYAEGELTLTGSIRATPGATARFMSAKDDFDIFLFPSDEVHSACVSGITGNHFRDLYSLAEYIRDGKFTRENFRLKDSDVVQGNKDYPDFSVVKGQEKAMNALMIAACGFHNIMILGSPGSGKTTAARIITGILPDLSGDEISQVFSAKECAGIGNDDSGILMPTTKRPDRYLYPGMSLSRIIGSPRNMIPGELALANHGVLIADEICEFSPGILASMRLPLEERIVRMNKDGRNIIYPASFLFVGTGNPCRCGLYYEDGNKCSCTAVSRKRYLSRINGPFGDRIDLFTEMRNISGKHMKEKVYERDKELSAEIRDKVASVWQIQAERYKSVASEYRLFNGTYQDIDPDLLRAPSSVVDYAVGISVESGRSARGFAKLMRVGRTIADMEERQDMEKSDISQAAVYRFRS